MMTSSVTLTITERSAFADGASFGTAGAYEKLKGRMQFAVDPDASAQAAITDLALAPRDEDGRVRFTADFLILNPVDRAKGNRRLFFDYGNRGNMRALQFFNDARGYEQPEDAGACRQRLPVPPRLQLRLGRLAGRPLPGDGRMLINIPVATDNGKPITGPVREEFIAGGAGLCFRSWAAAG